MHTTTIFLKTSLVIYVLLRTKYPGTTQVRKSKPLRVARLPSLLVGCA